MTESNSLEVRGSAAIRLASGEPGTVLMTDGDKATLHCPKAFPHGATVSALLEGSEFHLELKVFRCKKEGESYRIDGRLKNVSRAFKATLFAKMALAPSEPSSSRPVT